MSDYETIAKLRKIYDDLVKEMGDAIESTLSISFSSRFKTRAGDCRQIGINEFRIRLSKKLYNEFGYERIEKTFRHELAHLYCFKRRDYKHSQLFKRVCNQFGGSMNKRMAGWRYEESASKEYIPRTRMAKKWKYTCNKCKNSFERANKMSKKIFNNANRVCCHCKNPTTNFTEERI